MKSTGKSASKATKTAARPAAAKKPVASAKKAAPASKVSAKPVAKKTAVKRTAVKKITAKKTAAKKPTVKKAVAKKVVAKKPVAAKAPARSKARGVSAADARSLELLTLVEKSLDADKAENIVRVDLAEKSSIADFMVIATGRNSRQLQAMASHIAEKLGKAGIKSINIEGLSQSDWVLVDAGDIIVHLFRPEVRMLYGLEKMWGVNPPTPEALQAVG